MSVVYQWITGKTAEFQSCLTLRLKVFCSEQGYSPELEEDSFDETSTHLLLRNGTMPIGCGRLTPLDDGVFRLDKLTVLLDYRGKGFGKQILGALILRAKALGASKLLLEAQSHLIPFYESFGFAVCGMEKKLESLRFVTMEKCLVFDNAAWVGFDDSDAVIARSRFLIKTIGKTVLNVTAGGFVNIYVNGHPVNESYFSPAWTNYEKRDLSKINMPIHDTMTHRFLYEELDITPFVKTGINTLSFHIGNGWYGQRESRNEGMPPYGKLKLCFAVRNNGVVAALSDDSVVYTPSYITRTNIYFGETHDARLFDGSAFESECDTSDWKKVSLLPPPIALLTKQDCPPDKAVRHITPHEIYHFGDTKIYDLGENVSGGAVVNFASSARIDSKVVVRYGDELNSDGSINFFYAGGHARMQRDEFITDGKLKFFHPVFTWHAGRYFEVTGEAEAVDFLVIHTDISVISKFYSSNETLQWIYDTYIRTQLNNIHCCVPSDCPHRERLGYTGDGQLASRAVMTCFDAKALYKKWMRDIADCQDIFGGHVQHTAPFYGGGGGPGGWGGAIVLVPWNYYEFYGDASVLSEYYLNMRKYVDYMAKHSENGLVIREEKGGWCLGDWCTPNNILLIPAEFVNTYFLLKCVDILVKVNDILGYKKSATLKKVWNKAKKALLDTYFDDNTGSFAGGVQGADAFAIDLGFGDERTLKNLVTKYSELGEFDTGIFGTPLLIKALCENGEKELAFKLLTSEKDKTFYNMKAHGATTLWEEWEGTNSHFHPMFGAVVEYIIKYFNEYGGNDNG